MAAIDLAVTMQAIAAALAGVTAAKTVYPYPAAAVQPPCAVVGYPTSFEVSSTFQRGSDTAVFPIYFVCGSPSESTTRDLASTIISGAANIVTALETVGTVTGFHFDSFTANGQDYLSVTADLEVWS